MVGSKQHLAANLNLLHGSQPKLAEALERLSPSGVEIIPAVSGHPTASVRTDPAGSARTLHSRFDPVKEASELIAKTDLDGADYFVFLGFGLGYGPDALLDLRSYRDPRIFVVESNLSILRAAFEHRDLHRILTQPGLHFAWPLSTSALSEQWRQFFDPVHARKNVFLVHPPALALDPARYRLVAEVIQSETFQIFTDINTLLEKQGSFLDNFADNIPRALRSPGVRDFEGAFSNIPAILVSAGPSLDRNIQEMRRAENRALVISTDTALRPLRDAGIVPHFVVTADPSHENYRHLKESRSTGSLLIAEVTAFPESFSLFEGRTVTCTFENSSLRTLTELLGNKGSLKAWGSVATMALDFALKTKCDPIILVGQDLAYSKGRSYCSGVYFLDQWFAETTLPDTWDQRWKELARRCKTLQSSDIFGREVETTDKLTAYWNWITRELECHRAVRFINATEGGIVANGPDIMSLRDTLHHLPTQRSLRQMVDEIFEAARADRPHPGSELLVTAGKEASAIRRILELGLRQCRATPGKPQSHVLKDLDSFKESIYRHRTVAPLLDCMNQSGNIHFLRGRPSLKATPHGGVDPSEEISRLYREYFESVGGALNKLQAILERLDTGSQPSDRPASESSPVADRIVSSN